ncbi:MAG: transposase [Thermoplasmatales archaeon]|nr:transposase [Thermoplasmatales archaeon]
MFSFDEKAKIAIKQYNGYIYTKEKRVKHPAKQKVRGLLEMPAAINIHTGEIHYWFYDWKNSFIVIDFMQWLLYQVYPDEEVYIILDGWSAHRSNMFFAYADLQPRLHPVPLPTCSSWMNPIEQDFSHIQRDVLNNSDFNSPKEVMNMISAYIEKELNSN